MLDSVTAVAAVADRLQDLYSQTHSNARLRPFRLDRDYWPALAQAAGDRATFHVAKRDDEILGFVVTLNDGETGVNWHIGFDRETAASGVPVYLRLMHASLAQAISFKCRRVSFGRTALVAKAKIGCKPEPMQVWLRHRQPMFNQMVRPLLRMIQHDEAPEVSPFRKAAAEA